MTSQDLGLCTTLVRVREAQRIERTEFKTISMDLINCKKSRGSAHNYAQCYKDCNGRGPQVACASQVFKGLKSLSIQTRKYEPKDPL